MLGGTAPGMGRPCSGLFLSKCLDVSVNSLETRIEKMQERFNRDLEEIKKSQYIMNNEINGIKNTLEGINSRIMEAEEW